MCATKKSTKKTKNGNSTKRKKKPPEKCAHSRIWTSLELRLSRLYLRMSMRINQEPRNSSKKMLSLSHFKPNALPHHTIRCLNFYLQKLRGATGTRIEGRLLEECKYKQASVGSHRVQTDDFQTTYKKLV